MEELQHLVEGGDTDSEWEIDARETLMVALEFAHRHGVAGLRDTLEARRFDATEIDTARRAIQAAIDEDEDDANVAFYCRLALDVLERWGSG